jgi:D-alanyl-D-alanine carboxypeptidase
MRGISLGLLFFLVGCSSSSPNEGAPITASDAGDSGVVVDATPDVVPTDAPDPACENQKTALQTALDTAREATLSPDAILAVETKECGELVLTSGENAISPDDLFRIGSVTKTYVAAVVLGLYAEGKLDLDDTLDNWVVGVPNGSTATLRNLLNHTSGIYNYTDDGAFQVQAAKTWTPDELVALAAAHPPEFAPGTTWAYSNTNYVLLGMIAEVVEGAPIQTLIRNRLLQPLGLEHTFLDGSEPMNGQLAVNFLQNGADATNVMHPTGAWAAGAMVATADDTRDWMEQLASGQIQDANVHAEMLQPTPTGSPSLSWGLGVMLLDAAVTGGAGPGIGHGGDIPGFHTQSFYFPESEIGITSIVNKDGADPNDITAAVLQVLLQ